MEDSALDANLVTLVQQSIDGLAPSVQSVCQLDHICEGLQSLGCICVSDLQLLLSGDVLGTHSERPLVLIPAFRDDQDSGTTPWCGYSRGGAGWEAWDHGWNALHATAHVEA